MIETNVMNVETINNESKKAELLAKHGLVGIVFDPYDLLSLALFSEYHLDLHILGIC